MKASFRPQYVLILGAARSGTTLLASLLGHHPDAVVFNEDMRMGMLQIVGKRVVGNKLLVPFEIRLRERRGLLIRAMNRLGLLGFCRKTGILRRPFIGSFHSIEDYLEVEGIKILGILRNPRDTLASMVKRDSNWTSEFSMRNWVGAVRTLSQLRPIVGDRMKIVTFEDLVTEPERVMREVCAFTGLEYTPSMLDGCRFNPTYPEQQIRRERASRPHASDVTARGMEPDAASYSMYLDLTGKTPSDPSSAPDTITRRDLSLMGRLGRKAFGSAAAWGLLSGVLRAGSVMALLPLILRLVPTEELGVWYVFLSLVSIPLVINDGFSTSMARAAAYLWAGADSLLTFGFSKPPENDTGPEPNRQAMAELLVALRFYYRAFATVCWIVLASAGTAWVWRVTSSIPDSADLRTGWIVYITLFAWVFSGHQWPSLLSGINQVRRLHQIVVCSVVAYMLVTAAGLLMGFGVWALMAGNVAMELLYRFAARSAFRRYAGYLPRVSGRPKWRLVAGLWPNAWRTAAHSFAAYMAMPALVLVSSAFLDLATTASLGLTVRMVSSLIALSAIWVHVKVPHMNILRVQGYLSQMALLFVQKIRLSNLTFLAGAMALAGPVPLALDLLGARTQLLPFWPRIVFLLAWLIQMNRSLHFSLVLSENVCPFAWRSLLTGASTLAAAFLLAPRFGIWGLLAPAVIVPTYINAMVLTRFAASLRIPTRTYLAMFFGIRARAGNR
ncbi:MAG: hypothetical protein FJ224_05365 [Lentisphaerae bacterium]|nr:hypothetical protein [Lentisphaerota bacterium]